MTPRAQIVCGACAAERRREPSILGAVVVAAGGRVLWHGYDPRSARRLRNYDGTGDPPRARHEWVELDARAPERLTAACPRHGTGWVASAAIRNARGSISLKLTATR